MNRSTWKPAVGDVVAFSKQHEPGNDTIDLDSTGRVTRVAGGPEGQRLLEIDERYLRLQTEVRPR